MSMWKDVFDHLFKPVYQEMKELEYHITKKEWILFLKFHAYSRENLSQHLDKINSFTMTIGSNVSSWVCHGSITEEGLEEYEIHRDKVKERLEEIRRKIKNRVPTLWESVFQSIDNFIDKILQNLPILERIPQLRGFVYVLKEYKSLRDEYKRLSEKKNYPLYLPEKTSGLT